MEKYYPNIVETFQRNLSYLKDENVREKMEEYFLNECEKVSYDRDRVRSLKKVLIDVIQVLNTKELEYDIEYLLTFFASDFRTLFYELGCICIRANMTLTGICSCYVRYCGKSDLENASKAFMMEELLILYEEAYGKEVRQVFEDVLEVEKNLIQESYQKASQGETFCETCAPFCWVQESSKKGKIKFKRTTPFRY